MKEETLDSNQLPDEQELLSKSKEELVLMINELLAVISSKNDQIRLLQERVDESFKNTSQPSIQDKKFDVSDLVEEKNGILPESSSKHQAKGILATESDQIILSAQDITTKEIDLKGQKANFQKYLNHISENSPSLKYVTDTLAPLNKSQ